jgi:hypothetical protein
VESLFNTGEEVLGRRGFGVLLDGYLIDEKAGTGGDETGVERQLREAKAAKADDTNVPTYLWNERV